MIKKIRVYGYFMFFFFLIFNLKNTVKAKELHKECTQ